MKYLLSILFIIITIWLLAPPRSNKTVRGRRGMNTLAKQARIAHLGPLQRASLRDTGEGSELFEEWRG